MNDEFWGEWLGVWKRNFFPLDIAEGRDWEQDLRDGEQAIDGLTEAEVIAAVYSLSETYPTNRHPKFRSLRNEIKRRRGEKTGAEADKDERMRVFCKYCEKKGYLDVPGWESKPYHGRQSQILYTCELPENYDMFDIYPDPVSVSAPCACIHGDHWGTHYYKRSGWTLDQVRAYATKVRAWIDSLPLDPMDPVAVKYNVRLSWPEVEAMPIWEEFDAQLQATRTALQESDSITRELRDKFTDKPQPPKQRR